MTKQTKAQAEAQAAREAQEAARREAARAEATQTIEAFENAYADRWQYATENIQRYLEEAPKKHATVVEKMTGYLLTDPSYAMKWYAEEAVKTGWNQRNAAVINDSFTKGDFTTLLDAFAVSVYYADRDQTNSLSSIGRSSDRGSNLAELAEIEARAEFLNHFVGWTCELPTHELVRYAKALGVILFSN